MLELVVKYTCSKYIELWKIICKPVSNGKWHKLKEICNCEYKMYSLLLILFPLTNFTLCKI